MPTHRGTRSKDKRQARIDRGILYRAELLRQKIEEADKAYWERAESATALLARPKAKPLQTWSGSNLYVPSNQHPSASFSSSAVGAKPSSKKPRPTHKLTDEVAKSKFNPKGKLVKLTAKALGKIESAGKARKSVFDFVKQKWTTSSFSERVQLQRFAGRVLVRGTVGQQILEEFGEACSTCRSRGRIATEAAKQFYTKVSRQ